MGCLKTSSTGKDASRLGAFATRGGDNSPCWQRGRAQGMGMRQQRNIAIFGEMNIHNWLAVWTCLEHVLFSISYMG